MCEYKTARLNSMGSMYYSNGRDPKVQKKSIRQQGYNPMASQPTETHQPIHRCRDATSQSCEAHKVRLGLRVTVRWYVCVGVVVWHCVRGEKWASKSKGEVCSSSGGRSVK